MVKIFRRSDGKLFRILSSSSFFFFFLLLLSSSFSSSFSFFSGLDCPSGALCEQGATVKTLTPLPGYWMANPEVSVFTECKSYLGRDVEVARKRCCPLVEATGRSMCAPTNSSSNSTTNSFTNNFTGQCQQGYDGYVCRSCESGYILSGGGICVSCPGGARLDMSIGVSLGVCFFIGIVTCVFLVKSKADIHSTKQMKSDERMLLMFGYFKTLVCFIQIMVSMSTTLGASVVFPEIWSTFSSIFQSLNFDFVGAFSLMSCSLGGPFYHKFLSTVTLVPGMLLTFGLAFLIARFVKPPQSKEDKQLRESNVIKTLIMVFLLIYPSIATVCFSMFKCVKVEGVQSSLLESDFRVHCGEGDHVGYSIASAFVIVLFVIGCPLLTAIILFKKRKHLYNLKSDQHDSVLYEFGGLYSSYDPGACSFFFSCSSCSSLISLFLFLSSSLSSEFWYFECVQIVYKCTITGVMCIVGSGTALQPLFGLMFQLMFMLLVLKTAPFDDNLDDVSFFHYVLYFLFFIFYSCFVHTHTHTHNASHLSFTNTPLRSGFLFSHHSVPH